MHIIKYSQIRFFSTPHMLWKIHEVSWFKTSKKNLYRLETLALFLLHFFSTAHSTGWWKITSCLWLRHWSLPLPRLGLCHNSFEPLTIGTWTGDIFSSLRSVIRKIRSKVNKCQRKISTFSGILRFQNIWGNLHPELKVHPSR